MEYSYDLDIPTKEGFQLKSNIIIVVLLIQELIQVTLLAFLVISQVLNININNHCTENKLQEVKLNGSDKLKVNAGD